MGQIIATYPEQPCFTQTVKLGDAQFSLRLTWRERLGAWYADLWTAAGDAVWLGQRVSPGWPLGHGLGAEQGPDGHLYVRGPSEYSRFDLGSSVQIVFYATDEIPETEDSGGLAITIS